MLIYIMKILLMNMTIHEIAIFLLKKISTDMFQYLQESVFIVTLMCSKYFKDLAIHINVINVLQNLMSQENTQQTICFI